MTGFLGTGWAFPPRATPDGAVEMTSGEALVEQAIWLILATAPGERVQRPDFGCGIYDLVFAPNDATTAGRAEDAVRDALVSWEPRIDVLGVVAAPAPGRDSTLLIEIDYRVRTTNNRFNLVFPFYLEGGVPRS